jgi:hypothetical protein
MAQQQYTPMPIVKTVLFAVIAMREVEFFAEVARRLKAENPALEICFISFFQPGNRRLSESGFRRFDLYEGLVPHATPDSAQIRALEQRYGIDNLHRLLIHEKLTQGQYDDDVLLTKFSAYLARLDAILDEIRAGRPAQEFVVLQELGGFVAPLSLYFAARRHGIAHVFFEPSFFNGRLHYVVNGLGACRPAATVPSRETREKVRGYLSQSRSRRAPVVPVKDRHHFRDMGLAKVFNRANAGRLWRKLGYKWSGLRQEYEYPWRHTVRALRMLWDRRRAAPLYAAFDDRARAAGYVYFPFHVQLDYALTVRSPEYLDQIGLVRYLADVLPGGFRLYVKEHPASVGGFGYRALRELLHTHSNVRVIHPAVNSYDVIENAQLVVTINSKVGAEALMLGKQVVVLGDAFYSGSPLVRKAERAGDVDSAISAALGQNRRPTQEDVEQFFGQVWEASRAGELYVMENENVRAFADSLRGFLENIAGSSVIPRASLHG